MQFRKYGIGDAFILEADGNGLMMSREEAETLFVQIGHTLQDDDVTRYVEESTEGEQPDG